MLKKITSNYSISGFQRQLASIDSVPQFAILGVFSGLVTGLVILAFRSLIEVPLNIYLPGGFENFESLGWKSHLLLPIVGVILLSIGFTWLSSDARKTGVTHVLDRLARHQGHLPVSNLIAQFLGGTVALISGQSLGREGPAIHLGAAGSSLLGQVLKLPNNSIRVLVGCGTAAAISASFNTPIAGVIFSMEVIVLEYTMTGFIPVILASVTAALVNQSVYGSFAAFIVPQVAMKGFYDIPFLLLEGVVIGALAGCFCVAVKTIHRNGPKALWQRFMLAGLVTGLTAMIIPQVLGVGYDTVDDALAGKITFFFLLAIGAAKLLTSAVSIGLGLPAGLIGPTLFIGAVAGGILGTAGIYLFPELSSSPGLYVMLGMGAMMGAVLQAPLAALMAVMELTHNPNIILPAMLVIVVANITSSQLFRQKSLFVSQMGLLGLEFRSNPLSTALNRASMASIMSRKFVRTAKIIRRDEALQLVGKNLHWLLVDDDQKPSFIFRAEDLPAYLDSSDTDEIDLAEIPATRKDVTSVLLQATLSEAYDSLKNASVDALYVNRISAPMIDSVVGIATKEDIETFYQNQAK